MRATLTLDAELIKSAQRFTEIRDLSELVDHALQSLVHSEASKALAEAGGSEPDLVVPPRRRFEVAE